MKGFITAEQCERARRLHAQYGFNVACQIMGLGSASMSRLKQRNFQPAVKKRRPVPNDFRIVAADMNSADLCAHYRTSCDVIARWRRDTGVAGMRGGHAQMAIPVGAETVIRRLGTNKAAKHYGVHAGTITRWKRQLGIPLATARRDVNSYIGWAERRFAA